MTTNLRLTGWHAIEYVEHSGLNCGLKKYADPIEPNRVGLTPDEARQIAKEDPSLIYFDADATCPDHAAIMDSVSA